MSVTPWFRSPFTDITSTLVSHQWGGRCGDFELKFMECMEAYGMDRGLKKCDVLLQDYKECSNRFMQLNRTNEMRYERERQYSAGERSKEKRYADPPVVDSF